MSVSRGSRKEVLPVKGAWNDNRDQAKRDADEPANWCEQVEVWLKLNNIDPKGRKFLLNQSEDIQRSVVSLGHFREGRNESAGLVDRINRVKNGTLLPYRGRNFIGCRHCGVGNAIQTVKCEGCGRTLN